MAKASKNLVVLFFAAWILQLSAMEQNPAPGSASMEFTILGQHVCQPIIYSHGLFHDQEELEGYLEIYNSWYGLLGDESSENYLFSDKIYYLASFNYPEVGREPVAKENENQREKRLTIKRKHTSFGQTTDITRLNEAVNKFSQYFIAGEKIIGFGLSRGAATLINMMGTEGNDKIGALILESPFDDLLEVAKNVASQSRLGKIPLLPQAYYQINAKLFYPQYSTKGVQPIKVIDTIDESVPIIFIHSKEDEKVSINASRRLYIKRKSMGLDNVYLVELDHGPHGEILWFEDGTLYRNAVHVFLKEYGFTYDPNFADEVDLKDYQPTVEEVRERLRQTR